MNKIPFYLKIFSFINIKNDLQHSISTSGRSPIFSHMNATLQGLATIRAFNADKVLEKEFHEFQDHNTSCWYLFICASRWFALWLDLVCLLFIAFVTYSFLIFANGNQISLSHICFVLTTPRPFQRGGGRTHPFKIAKFLLLPNHM